MSELQEDFRDALDDILKKLTAVSSEIMPWMESKFRPSKETITALKRNINEIKTSNLRPSNDLDKLGSDIWITENLLSVFIQEIISEDQKAKKIGNYFFWHKVAVLLFFGCLYYISEPLLASMNFELPAWPFVLIILAHIRYDRSKCLAAIQEIKPVSPKLSEAMSNLRESILSFIDPAPTFETFIDDVNKLLTQKINRVENPGPSQEDQSSYDESSKVVDIIWENLGKNKRFAILKHIKDSGTDKPFHKYVTSEAKGQYDTKLLYDLFQNFSTVIVSGFASYQLGRYFYENGSFTGFDYPVFALQQITLYGFIRVSKPRFYVKKPAKFQHHQ